MSLSNTTISKSLNGIISITDGISTLENGNFIFGDGTVLSSMEDIAITTQSNTFTETNFFTNITSETLTISGIDDLDGAITLVVAGKSVLNDDIQVLGAVKSTSMTTAGLLVKGDTSITEALSSRTLSTGSTTINGTLIVTDTTGTGSTGSSGSIITRGGMYVEKQANSRIGFSVDFATFPNNFSGGIFRGTNDGADYLKYNLAIKSWFGIGFIAANTGVCSAVMDTRSGNFTCIGSLNSATLNITGNAVVQGTVSTTNSLNNKKLVLYDTANEPVATSTNFYGFGVNDGILRYQVPSAGFHNFYNGSLYKTVEICGSYTNINNDLNISGITSFTNGTDRAVLITDGGSLIVDNRITAKDLYLTSDTGTTGLGTGSLIVAGGVSIGRSISLAFNFTSYGINDAISLDTTNVAMRTMGGMVIKKTLCSNAINTNLLIVNSDTSIGGNLTLTGSAQLPITGKIQFGDLNKGIAHANNYPNSTFTPDGPCIWGWNGGTLITRSGNATKSVLNWNSDGCVGINKAPSTATATTSSNTGSLTVDGGIGLTGTINAANLVVNSASTVGSLLVQKIFTCNYNAGGVSQSIPTTGLSTCWNLQGGDANVALINSVPSQVYANCGFSFYNSPINTTINYLNNPFVQLRPDTSVFNGNVNIGGCLNATNTLPLYDSGWFSVVKNTIITSAGIGVSTSKLNVNYNTPYKIIIHFRPDGNTFPFYDITGQNMTNDGQIGLIFRWTGSSTFEIKVGSQVIAIYWITGLTSNTNAQSGQYRVYVSA
jgi:hypothetical protein